MNAGNAPYPDVNVVAKSLERLCKEVIMIDGSSLALEAGNIRTLNIVMLGASAETGRLPIYNETLENTMLRMVPPGTKDMNQKAFALGWNTIKGRV